MGSGHFENTVESVKSLLQEYIQNGLSSESGKIERRSVIIMKKLWKWFIVIIMILAVIVGVRSFSKKAKPVMQPIIEQTVKTQKVAMNDKADVISANGNIEAIEKVSISPKINGRVNQFNVENGRAVTKGETLVSLDSTELTNYLITAESNLNKSQIAYQNNQKNYERYQSMFNAGAISSKDLEGIKMQLDLSNADVQVASAAVANAREALNNTNITTPISGYITNTNVAQGQIVSPGITLFTVQDFSSVYILINIKQENISKVTLGMKASVKVDAYPNREFQGNIKIINPAADKASRVFEVKVKVDNPDLLLKPGMFAKVNLQTGNSKKVLTVPQEALSGKEGQYYVYTVEGNHAKRQTVEIGQILGQNVEIISGLSQEQQVIITNINKLKDQDLIRVTNE